MEQCPRSAASFHLCVVGSDELLFSCPVRQPRVAACSSTLPYLLPRAPWHLEAFFMLLCRNRLHDGQLCPTKEVGLLLSP